MIETLPNFLVNWLAFSALYALTAIGFTIIFGVGGVLNLAHGASITLSAFATYQGYQNLSGSMPDTMALVTAFAIALVIVGIFNAVLYLVFVRGLERVYDTLEEVALMVMIVTLLMALATEEFFRLRFGSEPTSVPAFVDGTIPTTNVEMDLLVGFIASWVIIGGLFLLIDRTKIGKALVAASMSQKGAEIVGVDLRKLYIFAWVLAGVLAGVGGVFVAGFEQASYTMGRDLLVISFATVILGGLGSIRGSVLGAYIIGFLEIGTATFISSDAVGITSFVVIVAVLLVRPEGLFGRELQVGE